MTENRYSSKTKTMKKIISLFQRNYDTDRPVRDEVTPGAEWVIAGEGVATYKWDGTCCMVRDGKLYKRHELKSGKTPPKDFEPATELDPITGKIQGWVPVGDGPEDKYHREAFTSPLADGTYELVGPAINKNRERQAKHRLFPHGKHAMSLCPRTYDGIKEYFQRLRSLGRLCEGVVFHHPDGRMVKIKAKDFGIKD